MMMFLRVSEQAPQARASLQHYISLKLYCDTFYKITYVRLTLYKIIAVLAIWLLHLDCDSDYCAINCEPCRTVMSLCSLDTNKSYK